MEVVNRVIKNTGILYLRMAITVFISLYSTRLTLTALGVSDFGIFNVVAGTISMLLFLNNAMTSATQRFISISEGAKNFDKVKVIFNVSVVLHIIIAILILILFEFVGYLLFDGILNIPAERLYVAKIVYQFMIVSTLFTIISVPYDAVINAHENMFLFAILGVIEAIFKLIIAFYLTYTGYDKLITYGFLTALSAIFLLIIRRIYCTKKYKECQINIKDFFDKSIFREMTSFAGWSFLGATSSMLSNYGQGVVMNMFFGPKVNTAQGISNQVSGQLGAFATTMLKALNPVIAKSEGAGNRKLMLQASITGSKIGFFLLIFFYVPVLIEMPYIFNLWLKNVPEYVIIFCRLLLLRNLIEQYGITLTSSIAAVGNIRKFQIIGSIINISPLIAIFILFKLNYPPQTAYYVFIVYAIVRLFQILFFSNKYYDLSISYFFKEVVLRCTVVFLLDMLICFLITNTVSEGHMRFLIVCVTSTMIFLIAIFFIGLNFEEKKNVRVLFSNLFLKINKNALSNK